MNLNTMPSVCHISLLGYRFTFHDDFNDLAWCQQNKSTEYIRNIHVWFFYFINFCLVFSGVLGWVFVGCLVVDVFFCCVFLLWVFCGACFVDFLNTFSAALIYIWTTSRENLIAES